MAETQTARGHRLRKVMGPGSGDNRDRRIKFAIRMRGLLTKTPDDGNGMVPETPFSQAGVVRLMDTLSERSRAGDTRTSKAAARVMNYLKPEGEGEPMVAGASVKKLQMLAKRTNRLQERGFPKRMRAE